jgi:hypothetical protein
LEISVGDEFVDKSFDADQLRYLPAIVGRDAHDESERPQNVRTNHLQTKHGYKMLMAGWDCTWKVSSG